MARPNGVQHRIAGLLVALLAVLFLAGPMADAALCAGDDLTAPAAAASQSIASQSIVSQAMTQAAAVAPASDHHGEAPGLCQHGHVHAAGALADQPVPAPVIRIADAAPRMAPPDQPVRLRLASGLDRPPRA